MGHEQSSGCSLNRGKGRALDITVEQFVTDRLVNVPFLKVNILDVQQSEHFSFKKWRVKE
jgi:hypothetical protein